MSEKHTHNRAEMEMRTVKGVLVLENLAKVQDPEVRWRWWPFVLPICRPRLRQEYILSGA